MRVFAPALLIAAIALPAFAQAPAAPPMKDFMSAAEVQAAIAKSRAARKDEPQINSPLLSLPPYRVQIEYRGSAGPPAIHDTEAEMMYVVEGAGTVTTGGTVIGKKATTPNNWNGTSIEGGVSRTFAKGDWLFVPQGVPHQISAVVGSIVLATFHVPRT